MTEDKAEQAAQLLNEIARARYSVSLLRKERESRATGLDPNAPGPKGHVLGVLNDRWDLLGAKCINFFIGAMDEAIADEENRLAGLIRELDRL